MQPRERTKTAQFLPSLLFRRPVQTEVNDYLGGAYGSRL
jgi:hypothetical protein